MPEEKKDLQFDQSEGFSIAGAQKVVSHNTEVDEYSGLGFFDRINEKVIDMSPVSLKSKVIFYRLLATMINAGVSLTKSMEILEAQFEDLKLKKICRKILHFLEEGESLTDALGRYPDTFEESELGMISSGEVSGQLNKVLLTLADRVEESAKIKGQIKGAMMYPIAIIAVVIIVLVVVLTMVVPQLADTFEQAGSELPAATQALMSMSTALVGSTFGIPNLILDVIFVVILYLLFRSWKKTKKGKYTWDNIVLHIPVFGRLGRKVILTQFCRSLASLSASGVSITKALNITSQTVGNEVYRKRILYIAEDVMQGIPIADNLKENKKMFPVMLTAMIEVGEKTAELGKICNKVADFYKEEVDVMVKTLSSLMEPLIIVIIGGVVGFIVTAIMSPIMQLSEVASKG